MRLVPPPPLSQSLTLGKKLLKFIRNTLQHIATWRVGSPAELPI